MTIRQLREDKLSGDADGSKNGGGKKWGSRLAQSGHRLPARNFGTVPRVPRPYKRLSARTAYELERDSLSGPGWRVGWGRIIDLVLSNQRRRDHRVFPVQPNSHDLSSRPLESS